jgi:hypothetical protein
VKAVRALVLACAFALLAAGPASADDFAGHHRQVFGVVVVRGLGIADLPGLASEGAIGLLVPNAGPRTSQRDAFAGMVRGILYNSRLPKPRDAVLIHVRWSSSIPLHGPVIVVGLPPPRSVRNDDRYPIAVIGPGYHGVLDSSLTRVPGVVSMADVARTALQVPHALTSRPEGGNAATLYRLEEQIETARSSTMAATVVLLALLAFAALLRPAAAPAAVGSALLANLALGWMPGGDAAPRVVLLGLLTAAGAWLGVHSVRGGTPLGVALVGVLAAYAVTMVVHPWALSLAPLGPELTSRFYGVSNLLETLLLVPALLGARLLGARFGLAAVAGVGLLTLTAMAENRFGDDGGGAIVVGVAFALLGVGMSGAPRRLALPALAVAGLAVFALVQIDVATSSHDHLRGALEGGVRGIAHVAANRVPLAYTRSLDQWYLMFPFLAALALGIAFVRSARSRGDAALMLALLAALGISMLVNDSPGAVTLAGLTAVLAVEGGLVQRRLVLPLAHSLEAVVRSPRPQE